MDDSDVALATLAKLMPKSTASYFVSLLVVANWRWTTHSIVSLSGDRSKTLAPPAC